MRIYFLKKAVFFGFLVANFSTMSGCFARDFDMKSFMGLAKCGEGIETLQSDLKRISEFCEGQELLQRISNVFRKAEPLEGRRISKDTEVKNPRHFRMLKLREIVPRENWCFFEQQRLDTLVTEKERGLILERNEVVRKKKINFNLNKDSGFDPKDCRVDFRSVGIDIIVLHQDGRTGREMSEPHMGLFHELLHLYHYIYDPITYNMLKNCVKIKREEGYRCKFIAETDLTSGDISGIDGSWNKLSNTGKACIPYLRRYGDLEAIMLDNPKEIAVDCEELMTIMGRKKVSRSMYDISENSYRRQQKVLRTLRYSHVLNIDFGGRVDKRLYDMYCFHASR